MNRFILILVMLVSTPSFAGEGTRSQYDEQMKASGKWGFISNFSFLTGVLAGGGAYYAHTRSQKYTLLSKDRPLTEHEIDEQAKWDQGSKVGAYTAGGLILTDLVTMGMSLQYEANAHAFALDMKVQF